MIAGDSSAAMPCATIACIIFMFCRATGEATIVGFMKALPQELIATYGTGTGLSDCIATGVILTMINFGVQWSYYFVFLFLCLVPVYFNCFIWFEEVRQEHAQYNNVFKLNINEEEANPNIFAAGLEKI